MTEFVLVSCSKSKLDGTHRAEDLYEPSDIFGKRRTFAEREGVQWGVLSAKHGYLRPWEAVENYERHISDRTPVWGAFVLDDLFADLEFYGVDQVTVLAGKRYVDPLVAELEAHGYDVVDYNRGLRPGERKRELKKANAPGEQTQLITDGGNDADDTYHAECVCGWSIERDSRAANLPAENNARIVRQVADAHENRPRFGAMADETHVTTVTDTDRSGGEGE